MLCSALAALAVEHQLAGIKIYMKPKDVIDLLGEPTAYLMPQPPLTGEGGGIGAVAGAAAGAVAGPEIPNTLIFLYGDKEIELDSPTGSAGTSTGPATPQAGSTKLPLWAYTVQVAKLSLDQQELIYQINDTYSIGVTITGQGAEAKVTDIVACSFEPLKMSPVPPTTKMVPHPLNFKYTKSKVGKLRLTQVTPGTSKHITIGSKFDEVLKAHQWPMLFLPFVTASTGKITVDPVTGAVVKDSPEADRVPDLSTTTTSNTVLDAMGAKIPNNFGTNCIMLYPDEKLALTLINFTVVRIQIGDGVRKPTPPRLPPPAAVAPH